MGNNACRNHPWGDCEDKTGVIFGVIFIVHQNTAAASIKTHLFFTCMLIAGALK
jgi:hypothetical protein